MFDGCLLHKLMKHIAIYMKVFTTYQYKLSKIKKTEISAVR